MRSALRFFALLLLLAIASVAWLLFRGSSANEDLAPVVPSATPPKPPKPATNEPIEAGCASLEELKAHPDVLAFHDAMDSWLNGGMDIEQFLNTDLAKVDKRARDGDQTAMLVMARAAMLEASGNDPGLAVPLLLHGGRPDNSWLEDLGLELGLFLRNREFSDEQRESLQSAQHWYYQLAIRGRLHYLRAYADLVQALDGGPVELRWISREDYERLNARQRRVFDPEIVYADLTGRFLLPNYHIFGENRLAADDRANREALIARLGAEFRSDLKEWQPQTPEEYGELRQRAYDVLREACAGAYDAFVDESEANRYRWPEASAEESASPNSRRDAAPTQ